jgi:hypothetical protein
MSKPLPEEIKFRIEQEAIKAAKKTHDFELSEWGKGSRDGYAQGHIAGAESYCAQYLAEKERADQLERWKAEATEVMSPIYDWFHKQKDLPLGSRMTVVILERLNQSAEERNILKGQRDLALKALRTEKERADKYEAGLKDIAGGKVLPHLIAQQLLSTQTDNKTEGNGKL